MKTLAQSLTVTASIYSFLIILLASFMALGADLETNPPAEAPAMQVVYDFEEEAYIDDIPFNTEAIAEQTRFERSMNENYHFEEEAYVDDIPFNTSEIASNSMNEYTAEK
jgi:hypothetical protein